MATQKKYTEMQKRAVIEEGKNLLVSASAGSGKTYVMIERVIRLILEGKADVNSILAVTYTVAAAEEMKQKLIKAVVGEINSGRDTDRFRKTLADIPTASISTFHGFCSSLLRNYFYAANLDPDFSVLDEVEARSVKDDALNELFDEYYERGDEDFLYLVRIYRQGRGDAKLKSCVNALYDFSLSEKSVTEFLQNAASSVNEKSFVVAQNLLFDVYLKKFKDILKIFERVEEQTDLFKIDKYSAYVAYMTNKIRVCLGCQTYRELLDKSRLPIPPMPTVRTEDESVIDLKEKIKHARGLLVEVCADVEKSSPNLDEIADLNDYLKTNRATEAICSLTLRFHEKYSQAKRDASVVDFSDLEHLTYELLTKNPDVLQAVKDKYEYVFADEYQDVNGVQEAILNLITDDNLFMVGDVKQSIYAFRGCNPEIFANKYEDYAEGRGIPVSLDVNFRSSDGVLKAVNDTFSPIMTKDFGGVDYAANPMVGSGLYESGYGKCILHETVIPKNKQSELPKGVYDIVADINSDEDDDAFYEGLEVARIIKEEIGSPVYDVSTGHTRPATPKDVAVLTRNSSGFTTEIIKQLKRLSLPVSSSAKNPIGDYPEIKLLTDVLRLIDYFADDAPLIAALLSPIGGLSQEEAAIIRYEAPKKGANGSTSFCDAYEFYLNEGKNEVVRNKLLKFDDYISKIRLISQFCSAGELLKKILVETGLDLDILSRPTGEIRLKRVDRFIAESCAQGKRLTVSEFLKRLDGGLGDVSVGSSDGDDSISVMSMHASKGLEFPIVILAGLSKRFNIDDVKKEILTDRKYGIALKLYDENTRTVKSTLVREALKERARLDLVKEEMRVFYVAMTRAKDRMHLVCSSKQKAPSEYSSVLFANKFADFIDYSNFVVDTVDAADLTADTPEKEKREITLSAPKESLVEKIRSYLSYNYPYTDDSSLPVKRAVTKLVEESVEPLVVDFDEGSQRKFDQFARSRGTAYHAYLQYCDLAELDTAKEIKRLVAEGKITDESALLLDKTKLTKIISADVFDQLEGYELYREQPFVVSLPANEVSDRTSTSGVLVQGVIDLLAVKDGKAIIIDYKNSHKSADELKDRYRLQLEIYKKAVEKALRLTVEKTFLFNLTTLESIEV